MGERGGKERGRDRMCERWGGSKNEGEGNHHVFFFAQIASCCCRLFSLHIKYSQCLPDVPVEFLHFSSLLFLCYFRALSKVEGLNGHFSLPLSFSLRRERTL